MHTEQYYHSTFNVDVNSPIIATAIHDGHKLRDEVAEIMALTGAERLREEDPFTARFANLPNVSSVYGKISRFEFDLNRQSEKAVYIEPKDAWGLTIWKKLPNKKILRKSLRHYHEFYNKLYELVDKLERKFKKIVILDIHSYNHRREGVYGNPHFNPDIEIGTKWMENPNKWSEVLDFLHGRLSNYNFMGRYLDVKRNVKFGGGFMQKYITKTFPSSCCVLSIEVKKFFMDELNGSPDDSIITELNKLFSSTVNGVSKLIT